MNEVVTPDWVKHAVFYQIFPDRFARSARAGQAEQPRSLGQPADHVRGLQGRRPARRASSISTIFRQLGATAIYFTPIFQSASNHRYHTHDYYQVDPLLGGNAAFRRAAGRGTAARPAAWCSTVCSTMPAAASSSSTTSWRTARTSPWLDWFYVDQPSGWHPINAYDSKRAPGIVPGGGLHALPKLNTDNPQVREYLMRVGEYWLRKGIDGWRLDVPFEISTPASGRSSAGASRRSIPTRISSARSGTKAASGFRATSSTR